MDTCKQRVLPLVSEVALMEARLGPVGRYGHPFFQHSQGHFVGFIRDLEKAGSVGFVRTAEEHVGLLESWCSEVHHRCAAVQWSSSMVTSFFFWRSAIVVHSQRQFQFRSCVSVGVWTTAGDSAQRAFGGVLRQFRSDWSLRWLDVCLRTDAETRCAFAVREGCHELDSEVGRVSERTVQETLKSRSLLRAVAPETIPECSSSEQDEVSLAQRESRAAFSEVSLQLLDPSAWELVANGGFFRE